MGYGLMFLLYEPISFINSSLRASLAHQPHLSTLLRLLASVPTMPARFTTSFIGLSRSIYLLFTSFTPMGLLLNSLGFLGPFTTSWPFITILGLLAIKLAHWVYQFILWASPTHLLLLYLLLFPWAYYFIHWASLAHLLILYFFYFHGPAGHQSCCFSPVGLFPYFFTVLPLISFSSSLLLGFFCYWALCKKWALTTENWTLIEIQFRI